MLRSVTLNCLLPFIYYEGSQRGRMITFVIFNLNVVCLIEPDLGRVTISPLLKPEKKRKKKKKKELLGV